jgi:ubiquinone/menaquinone biosynthesis C-methylase UbiE
MADGDTEFVGSIPELYDSYLVPLIFESYADDLANRIAELSPKSVLEIAAGSGVVSRSVAPRLSTDAQYVVTDLNQPMLDHAASKQGKDARITWQKADAQNLPFESELFDVVLCQFGVMFFPDRVASYIEARRVLRNGGSFIFSVWDDIAENEFAKVVTDAIATIFPQSTPSFLERTPHGYHNEETIQRELEAAGFKDIEVETVAAISSAPSPRHVAIAYCQGTPLRNEIESLDASLLSHATDRATEEIALRFGSENVSAKTQGLVVKATR